MIYTIDRNMTIEEIEIRKEGQTLNCKSIQIDQKALALPIVAMANATARVKTAVNTVDSQLHNETVDLFMQHTDSKFICIGHTLDTTKKFNLKNKMQDRLFAF